MALFCFGIAFEIVEEKSFYKPKNFKAMTMITVKPENGRVAFPRITSWLDNFIDNDFPGFNNFESFKTPALVNTIETKDAYQIELAAPGFEKDQFKIAVEEKVLSITAEKDEQKLEEGNRYTRREYNFTSLKRHFTLPKTVDAAKIAAEYKSGILFVSLPKLDAAKEKAVIEVKVS
jgi:HSP20 family protein